MFYRRKLLLALLETLGRPVSKIEVQKLLLLICESQVSPAYCFIPHKFGCYSFQVDADKRALTKYGLIKDIDKWHIDASENYIGLLRPDDATLLLDVVSSTRKMNNKQLLKFVYKQHPYYATRSEIREELLTDKELKKVEAARPAAKRARLFTIGYESRTLEQYLNLLSNNKVQVLCDVRRNAMSMKFGFNKHQLARALSSVGIEYIHMPELGIASNKRSKLETAVEFEKLFDDYERTTLAENSDALGQIVSLIASRRRVALTCFELCHEDCHRHRITSTLAEFNNFGYKIAHL